MAAEGVARPGRSAGALPHLVCLGHRGRRTPAGAAGARPGRRRGALGQLVQHRVARAVPGARGDGRRRRTVRCGSRSDGPPPIADVDRLLDRAARRARAALRSLQQLSVGQTAAMPDAPRAVIFDLDGVIRDWNDEAMYDLEAAFGLPPGTILSVGFGTGARARGDHRPRSPTASGWTRSVGVSSRRTAVGVTGALDEWEANVGTVDTEMLAVLRSVRRHCTVGGAVQRHDPAAPGPARPGPDRRVRRDLQHRRDRRRQARPGRVPATCSPSWSVTAADARVRRRPGRERRRSASCSGCAPMCTPTGPRPWRSWSRHGVPIG